MRRFLAFSIDTAEIPFGIGVLKTGNVKEEPSISINETSTKNKN